MSRLDSTNEEFIKIKDALIKDIKIIQTEQASSQKKIKIAEEIVQKTKIEYKKLNDEYIKLQNYKNKCENFIKQLQEENQNLKQQLKQQVRHNYYRNKNTEFNSEQQNENEEEEEGYNDKNNDVEIDEEDITEITRPVKKSNKPPPKKKKKGISNFI